MMPRYLGLPPRMPKRRREVRCFADCLGGAACECDARDLAAWEAEGERRADAWRNGDDMEGGRE